MSIAESQDRNGAGAPDNPANSDCNPYTAYWGDGSGLRLCERVAPECLVCRLAAWVWRQAGVSFTYGFAGSDINAWSASFYFWGLATGNWHSLSSGYQPQPGDVAVYGNLSEASGPGRVGIYVGGPASRPTVVNGNWAVNSPAARNYGVIVQSNESSTRAAGGGLDGYVSVPNQPGGGSEPDGGNFTGSASEPMAITQRPDGETDVAVVGSNNELEFYFNDQGSSQWNRIQIAAAGGAYSAPAMLQRPSGKTDIAVQGPGNDLDFYINAPGQPTMVSDRGRRAGC